MKSVEKREIVDTLLGLEDVNTSFFLPPSPNLCKLHEGPDTRPTLAKFVAVKSWFVFDQLNLIIGYLDWMLKDDKNK